MNFAQFLIRLPFMNVGKFLRKDTKIVLPGNCTQRFMQFLQDQECEFHWHADFEQNRTTFFVQYHAWKEPLIKRELDLMAYGN